MRLRLTLLSTLTVLALAGCSGGEEECTGPDCEPSACSPACGGATPICDEAAKTCKACTADKGCGADEVCDTSVAKGQCVDCTSDSHCSDPTPICDLATKSCVVCTAYYGCLPGDYCDTSYPNGRCVTPTTGCTDSGECAGATPVCNTQTRQCVVCTPTEGCEQGETCNTAVAGGRCDAESTGCANSGECSAPTPVCDTQASQCVVCTATEGCEPDETCNTAVAGGRCETESTGCANSGECSTPTPVCNTQTQQCVVCTATEGCGGSTPKCNVAIAGGQCVQCLANPDCAATPATPVCSASNLCVAQQGSASEQIAAARAAADGTGLSLPIHGALVTYVKAAVGNDAAGFVLQADRIGPALFVKVDPATLSPAVAVGDSVNLTVTALDSSVSSIKMATAINGYSRVSAGNPVTSLVQDLSSATDIVSNLGGYECELIRLSGTVAGPFAYGGSGHQSAPFSTSGVPNDTNLKVRLAQTLKESLGLEQGCSFTINYGVMWRHNAQAQPSAYSAAELTNVNCPAPLVVSARALSATSISVTFDREIDAASVLGNGSQFTFSGGLSATSASVNGTIATVGTSAQASGTQYTVTVANTVLDLNGRGISSAQNSASFDGFAAVTTGGLVINELDYDQAGTDTAEFIEVFNPTSSASSLADLALVFFNGASSPAAEYYRVALSEAGASLPAGGYLVVHLAEVTPAPGALSILKTAMAIQNGPDAVALVNVRDNSVLDALSYEGASTQGKLGNGTVLDIAEGDAAPADPGDGSLCRIPNGQDTDDNSADFSLSSTPTPGAANTP